MDEMEETEVTLGTGKLLAMFFGAAIICGIFFSFGYAVGKNSAPAAGVAIMDSSTLANNSVSGGSKPAASRDAVAVPDAASAPATDAQSQNAAPAPELAAESPKLTTATPSAAPGAGYVVQVAAVSKAEDAETLKDALAKKQYPVFVVNSDTSHLFHVQVGPFSDQKDAEAMKNKLAGDGYNAILKK